MVLRAVAVGALVMPGEDAVAIQLEVTRLMRDETSVTGQTVVDRAIVAVTTATDVSRRGQFVISGPQLRTVTARVAQTVEVDTAGTYSTTTMLEVAVTTA